MIDMAVTARRHDFSGLHAAMQRYVDAEILAGVSSAVIVGRELADVHCAGWADREAQVPLRTDHLFRIYSNTKLVTSCAVLLLLEQGELALDDPVERFLPQLANRRVLRPGAQSASDTEPAAAPIRIRQLLSHSSGLSYGLSDPGTLMYRLYNEAGVRNPATTLAQMIDVLADLPLSYQPGTWWEYSIATDVLARVVEVVGGRRFDEFIRARIFEPLDMSDTAFVVPPDKQARLAAYYAGADLLDPMKPGLTRTDDAPYPGAYLQPVPRLSGGGGLVSTLPDMVALVRSLLPGGETLLQPSTIAMLRTNQLAPGVCIGFAGLGPVPGKVFGLAGALTVKPSRIDPPGSTGELEWGGIAGTHWWISRDAKFAGLVMTQRQMAFWHPFSFELKRHVYASMGSA